MKYAIVFSSSTGNTRQIAEAIRDALPAGDCVYYGGPQGADVAGAELVFAGFWTDKGTCPQELTDFLNSLSDKQVALFGTAGFGGAAAYFNQIMKQVWSRLPAGCRHRGSFMCQGRMPDSVKNRYEAMLLQDPSDSKIQSLLENFYQASSHPDAADLEAARRFAHHAVKDHIR